MKKIFQLGLMVLILVSCGPAVLVETGTSTPTAVATLDLTASPTGISTGDLTGGADCYPEAWPCPSDSMTMTAVMGSTFAAISPTPTCDGLCSADSMTLTAAMALTLEAISPTPTCDGLCPTDSMAATAAMALTFAAIPSNTPPAGVTVIPVAGDLGWGAVYGVIADGVTNLPIEGARVRCEHFSYTSQYPCHGVTTTNGDGIYSFVPVYFHDTDRITLIVEAPGYTPLHFEEESFTRPEFHADLGLFPATTESLSPTPPPYMLMCTPPACAEGVLVCGAIDSDCPGGCGAVCMPWTPTRLQ
jgi:hypothetical protein